MAILTPVVAGAVKHSLMRTISVICTLLVIGGLVWAVYVTIIKPHTKPTPTQRAEQIINNTYYEPERRGFINLDCLWGWVRVSLGPQREVKK